MIFNLCLRQCSLIVYAPVDRPRAFVNVAALNEAAKQAGRFRFVMIRHGQVRIVPLTQDPEPLKVTRLSLQGLGRVFAAGAANRHRRHVGFFSTELAVDI